MQHEQADRTQLRPITIAGHRGAMAHAPENSLQSYALAESVGADEIELDVRMTRDGELVVLHDSTLDRVAADERGKNLGEVANLTMAELAQVQLTSGRSVLRLEEAYAATSITMQVEIKAPHCVQALATFMRQNPQHAQRTLFTSFRASALKALKELLPEVPRGIIVKQYPVTDKYPEGLATLLETTGSSIFHCGWQGLTSELVDSLHADGYGVRGWPMRTTEDMARAIELGIDGTTSDDPALARSWWMDLAGVTANDIG